MLGSHYVDYINVEVRNNQNRQNKCRRHSIQGFCKSSFSMEFQVVSNVFLLIFY
jgi:hypothetical protein